MCKSQKITRTPSGWLLISLSGRFSPSASGFPLNDREAPRAWRRLSPAALPCSSLAAESGLGILGLLQAYLASVDLSSQSREHMGPGLRGLLLEVLAFPSSSSNTAVSLRRHQLNQHEITYYEILQSKLQSLLLRSKDLPEVFLKRAVTLSRKAPLPAAKFPSER